MYNNSERDEHLVKTITNRQLHFTHRKRTDSRVELSVLLSSIERKGESEIAGSHVDTAGLVRAIG